MVKDHSDSERGKPLFPISSKGSFVCTIPHSQESTYHSLCYTSRGELAGTKNSSIGPLHIEGMLYYRVEDKKMTREQMIKKNC